MRHRILYYLGFGILVGATGILIAGLAHAVIIMPVWSRVLTPLPFAIVGGTALAWALDEFRMVQQAPRLSKTGWGFGALVWLCLIPVTVYEMWLRASGVRKALPWLEVPSELALIIGAGLGGGYLMTRSWRATLALGCAVLVVALAMGGAIPIGVPITTSMRSALFFLSFLPALMISCAVLGFLLKRFR